MENLVFKGDYRISPDEKLASLQFDPDTFRQSWLELEFSNRFLSQIPKIISPSGQKTFIRLLKQCSEQARKLHGLTVGVIDFQAWEAKIMLTLPFIEYAAEEFALLRDMAENAAMVSFAPDSSGSNVILSIHIEYFEELDIDRNAVDKIFQHTKSDFEERGLTFPKWNSLDDFFD